VLLTVTPRALRVAVTDNGPGISREDQAIIFEKFRQAGDTMTEKPQGTGLGLPISRQIVEHFGGELSVASEPGQGATFAFELPLSAAQEHIAAALAAGPSPTLSEEAPPGARRMR